MNHRRVIGIAAIASIPIALPIAFPRAVVRACSKIAPEIVWQCGSEGCSVALSFDDGPDPQYTPRVLDLLRENGIRATFFLIGERVLRHPELRRRIEAEGHEIANHSMTWRRTLSLSDEEFTKDLLEAEKVLGIEPRRKLFRPAGVWIRSSQLNILRQFAYTCVLGSSYACDPLRPPSAFIRWMIAKSLRAGGIAVLHDSGGDRSRSVDALPGIITAVRKRGLSFTTIGELMTE
jgi:peptidoglycan/xylan/chitin deacetylase (PgdA/CDA1 family)